MCAPAAAIAGNGDEGAAGSEEDAPMNVSEQRMEKIIDVYCSDTDITKVIQMIVADANLNVIVSPKVEGTVTATLKGVPVKEALRNILETHGYGYAADENMIRIAPIDEIVEQSERIVYVSKVYDITYANVQEVAEALEKFKSPGAMVAFNKGTSNIIVTDTEQKIEAMDRFVEQIDRITPQILVEVRIYDISSEDELDLGFEWNAGRNTTIPDPIGSNPTAGRTDPFLLSGFEGGTSNTADATSGFIRVGILNAGLDWDLRLRAEQEYTDAKLLANPRILVLDNETATFNIIREEPYTERTISGATVTESVKFKPVGVNLAVTPKVTRDEMLRLHIVPEFNVFKERVTLSTDATNVPVVDTRKLNTIALVKSQQTVVLGGLHKKDVSMQMNKIPLLGDIPLIGGLFRFEGEDTVNTELIVFITPEIVELPALTTDESEAYELTRFSRPKPKLTRAEKKAEGIED
jgi:type IV pilus assembly protein PilQ